MTDVSTVVRRGTRLITQLLIAAIAVAAIVLFSYALHYSTATEKPSSGRISTSTPH
ncbi:hypothetical protein [Nocardia spumae]|uniref:hypothetical protein n=1 Tax=Nocardia spumae TaxID=2887190 RepID=UPI001D1338C8|nr:hypothetical protein [Nocardia spumae]